MDLTLSTPITKLPLVGPYKARLLDKLQIYTIEDLLYHLPHRYNDFSHVTPISRVRVDETVTITATIDTIKTFRTKTGKQLIQATVHDTTGKLTLVWFNQTYLLRMLHEGDNVSFSGKISWFGNKIVLSNPQFELIPSESDQETLHTGRVVAVYPETEGVTSKWLRNRIHGLLDHLESLMVDELPERIQQDHLLYPLPQALRLIHFPETIAQATNAKRRIAFDELFFYQLRSKLQKRAWERDHISQSVTVSSTDFDQFLHHLPFTLTNDQQNSIQEVMEDLKRTIPMNRLLVGDVGSGKTIIAAFAMYAAYQSGYSSVLMAPTQILAEQHHHTISTLLAPLKIQVDLMTGSTKTITNLTTNSSSLFSNDTKRIVVGTHALFSNQEKLGNVGVVIIDEQHRFGVKQRSVLIEGSQTNVMPHLLTMTATPIPRTIAKSIFGNVDVSFLLTMPQGRIPIKTWLVPNQKRLQSYDWMKKQIQDTGGQIFIVCPFIELSETMISVKAVTQEYEQLRKIFKEYSVGLLHGKMKAEEKSKVLHDFKEKHHHILLATPVVEVGIDIPNATVIVIEAAERFGLGQLHQLRGRVGRGKRQSYCLLFTETTDEAAITRLKALERITSGPKLAELDLTLRGAGDIFGTKQHGIPTLKAADLSDMDMLKITNTAAQEVIDTDPDLTSFPILREKLKKATIEVQSD